MFWFKEEKHDIKEINELQRELIEMTRKAVELQNREVELLKELHEKNMEIAKWMKIAVELKATVDKLEHQKKK